MKPARARAPTVTPGYWRDEVLMTRAAFDEEELLSLWRRRALCDARRRGGRLPLFDGRIAEDFKLATGTWVSVGPLRAALVAALAPLARDAVIAGHDRDEATALIFPDLDACRSETGATDLNDPALREAFRQRLAAVAAEALGSSKHIARILLLAAPPSLDAGEITDKGSLNQRAVLQRRTEAVAALYAQPSPESVIKAR